MIELILGNRIKLLFLPLYIHKKIIKYIYIDVQFTKETCSL